MQSITSITSQLEAALAYAERLGWHIWPVTSAKTGFKGTRGRSDATTDPDAILSFWRRWPSAQIGVATGTELALVAIDVDIRETFDGRDSLGELGIALHPETWTTHTPSGSFHLLFRHPGFFVKTIAGDKPGKGLGLGLDIRGDGGSITLPPGPGRFWDPHLNPDTIALAEFPDWARIPELVVEPVAQRQHVEQRLTRYGEVALDRAAEAIVSAPAGQQEATLNREGFALGQLVGGGVIPVGAAEDILRTVARRMPSYDQRRPWTAREIDTKIRNSLFAGMREPRRPAHGR